MQVTSISLLVRAKRSELESKLKNNGEIDDFDIQDLDKADEMKDVMISFTNPVDLKYASESIQDLLKDIVMIKTYE